MDEIETPLADEFIELRARHQALMEMDLGGTEFEIATWMSRLDALHADIKRSPWDHAAVTR